MFYRSEEVAATTTNNSNTTNTTNTSIVESAAQTAAATTVGIIGLIDDKNIKNSNSSNSSPTTNTSSSSTSTSTTITNTNNSNNLTNSSSSSSSSSSSTTSNVTKDAKLDLSNQNNHQNKNKSSNKHSYSANANNEHSHHQTSAKRKSNESHHAHSKAAAATSSSLYNHKPVYSELLTSKCILYIYYKSSDLALCIDDHFKRSFNLNAAAKSSTSLSPLSLASASTSPSSKKSQKNVSPIHHQTLTTTAQINQQNMHDDSQKDFAYFWPRTNSATGIAAPMTSATGQLMTQSTMQQASTTPYDNIWPYYGQNAQTTVYNQTNANNLQFNNTNSSLINQPVASNYGIYDQMNGWSVNSIKTTNDLYAANQPYTNSSTANAYLMNPSSNSKIQYNGSVYFNPTADPTPVPSLNQEAKASKSGKDNDTGNTQLNLLNSDNSFENTAPNSQATFLTLTSSTLNSSGISQYNNNSNSNHANNLETIPFSSTTPYLSNSNGATALAMSTSIAGAQQQVGSPGTQLQQEVFVDYTNSSSTSTSNSLNTAAAVKVAAQYYQQRYPQYLNTFDLNATQKSLANQQSQLVDCRKSTNPINYTSHHLQYSGFELGNVVSNETSNLSNASSTVTNQSNTQAYATPIWY